jgi:cellulose synthase/poly-beta-1,6-N-acetylglucosamine synthase-like glycosyltransferase
MEMQIVFWVSLALIAYTVGCYPLLMWVVCRGRRRAPARLDDPPQVSLIVAAYNEEIVLEAKIENSLRLDYPPERLEIIIASGGSTDSTLEIARRYESRGVRALDLPAKRGKASAVNDAAAVSAGAVLCLSDANVMLRPDALQKLVAPLADARIGAVTADVRLESDQSDFGAGESLYYKLERAVQLGESRFGSVMGVDGGLYVIRRELFQPLAADTILDDFVTSMNVSRQHRRIVYEPDAIATENGTPSWKDEFRRRVRVMVGAVQSIKRGKWPPLSRPVEVWQYLSHKLLRWVQPVSLLLLLVSSGWLWSAGPLYKVILGVQLAFYVIAVAALVSPRLRNTRIGGVPFYFTMSHAAMLIGLVKGLITRPSGVWTRTPRIASGEYAGSAALGGDPGFGAIGIGSQRTKVESATDA